MMISEEFGRATHYHSAGDFRRAEQAYQRILAVVPAHPVAMHQLGLIAMQTGDTVKALELCQRAAQTDPFYPDVQTDLGCILRDTGKIAEAIASFERAVSLDPNAVIALHNLAEILTEQGQYERALAFFQRVLELRPDLAETHCSLGNLWKKTNQTEAAIASYRRAIELKPGYVASYNNLGVIMNEKGDQDQAIAYFEKTLQLAPDHADACNNLGRIFYDQENFPQAEVWCRRAIELKPGLSMAIYNLGRILQGQQKFEEAAAVLRTALTIFPTDPDLHLNLGNILLELDQPAAAAVCYQQVLKLVPDTIEAETNLGMALAAMEDYHGAIQCYERVLKRHPEDVNSHFCLSVDLLILGDYPRGFREFEYRLLLKDSTKFDPSQSKWTGESLVGKTLILVSEQGLGDMIQFVRFAAKLKQRGGTILFYCVTPLVKLLSEIPGVDGIIPYGDPMPDYDYYAPLMSVPGIIGTTLEEIPALLSVPYLKPDPDLVAYWTKRLGPRKPGELRIGLAWQGCPTNTMDHYRSIPLESFVGLSQVPGLRLVSFQRNQGVEQIPSVRGRLPLTCFADEPRREVDSFLDSAALMSLMDVMISVDSAPIHLAGALGVRTWLLCRKQSEWRWMRDREDSPWYPSIRIFRQTVISQWDDVIERVTQELNQLVAIAD
jgi:tetratricopeptide (TPR) repeat protein